MLGIEHPFSRLNYKTDILVRIFAARLTALHYCNNIIRVDYGGMYEILQN